MDGGARALTDLEHRYYETSANSGAGVDDMFQHLFGAMHAKFTAQARSSAVVAPATHEALEPAGAQSEAESRAAGAKERADEDDGEDPFAGALARSRTQAAAGAAD